MQLCHLSTSQVKPASGVAMHAFFNDPMTIYCAPDESERFRLKPVYELDINYGRLYGEACVTSPNLEGAAVWMSPQEPSISTWRMLRTGGWLLPFKVNHSILSKLMTISAAAARVRRRLVPFPHWYLAIIFVHPEKQGKGHAGALLRPMLERIDSEGLPCYLETTDEKNVSLYERFGFRVLETSEVEGTQIRIWYMLRIF